MNSYYKHANVNKSTWYVGVVCSEVNKKDSSQERLRCSNQKKYVSAPFQLSYMIYRETVRDCNYSVISLLKAIKFQRCGTSSTSSSFYMNDVSTGDNKQIPINDSVAR